MDLKKSLNKKSSIIDDILDGARSIFDFYENTGSGNIEIPDISSRGFKSDLKNLGSDWNKIGDCFYKNIERENR